jgi:hypothetical protein
MDVRVGRWRRRRGGMLGAARRLRDDAYRVHAALDETRDAWRRAAPELVQLARTIAGVRASVRGSGRDAADLLACLGRSLRRGRAR